MHVSTGTLSLCLNGRKQAMQDDGLDRFKACVCVSARLCVGELLCEVCL